jgi:hypothetical protein
MGERGCEQAVRPPVHTPFFHFFRSAGANQRVMQRLSELVKAPMCQWYGVTEAPLSTDFGALVRPGSEVGRTTPSGERRSLPPM